MSSQPFALIPLSDRMEAEPLRVVLLGKTGAGKSSFGNTLIGRPVFRVDGSTSSGTSECQAEGNDEITVIDTPGFCVTNMSDAKLKSEIIKSITMSSPGPHAFLILLKVERFSEHEQEVITKIEKCFSEEVFNHAVLVFTHGDQLGKDKTIQQFIDENEALKDLSDKCGGSCHVVDNKYWNGNQEDPERNNQVQIRRLINTIRKMVEKNGGKCYTNEMLQEVERRIREEEERTGSREEAKKIVTEWFHEKTRDVETEGLWGAFPCQPNRVKEVLSVGVGVATGVGAGVGAAVGAVVGGPVGAAVGAAIGGLFGGAAAAAGHRRGDENVKVLSDVNVLKQTNEEDEVNPA